MPLRGHTMLHYDHRDKPSHNDVVTEYWHWVPEDYMDGIQAQNNMVLDPLPDGVPVGQFSPRHNQMIDIKEEIYLRKPSENEEGFILDWNSSGDAYYARYRENELEEIENQEIREFSWGELSEDYMRLVGLLDRGLEAKQLRQVSIEQELLQQQNSIRYRAYTYQARIAAERNRVEITADMVTERATRSEETLYANYLERRRERRERRNREV